MTGHDGGQVLQIGGFISGGPAASVSCGFDEEARCACHRLGALD